jgi:transposase
LDQISGALQGYLHEALEVDGKHSVKLLFTPAINQDIHSVFLRQITEADPGSQHVVVMDQAGFHMKQGDARVPENIRILPLPPYCPELNPAEWFSDGRSKPRRSTGSTRNLEKLEEHLIATARKWSAPSKVASFVHQWMQVQVNAIART